ncbi:conserved hypothetical protein [uncultured Desulfobacterium sp.]|uniref:Uncharacterized protein n=1 Tax=uncultured Desulfobacterium sp. TaxID=201089 RepID=A0A445MYE2_9BACT|nr:conserved hypothetical protein [uncultured Desulfobacterium sp.]
MEGKETVDSLKKVSLLFESGTLPDRMDLTSGPDAYTFVFGAGSGGITPFEYEIIGKAVGDEVLIQMRQEEIEHKFEHMAQFIAERIPTGDIFYIKVKIIGITKAENREIVQSMAESIRHGSHSCDCGCGCDG